MSRIPLASGDIFREGAPIQTWDAEVNPELNSGKPHKVIAGGSLGGASRINAMIYARGNSSNYNFWSDEGHEDWSYNKLLPYFLKSESSIGQRSSNFRGTEGKNGINSLLEQSNNGNYLGSWITQNFHDRIPFSCVRL